MLTFLRKQRKSYIKILNCLQLVISFIIIVAFIYYSTDFKILNYHNMTHSWYWEGSKPVKKGIFFRSD